MEFVKTKLNVGDTFVVTTEMTIIGEPVNVDGQMEPQVKINWGSAVDLAGSHCDNEGNSQVGEFSNGADEPHRVFIDRAGELHFFDEGPQTVELDKQPE